MPDWIFAWVICGVAIWLLLPATRWIHKHLQGLGLLMTNNPRGAVMVYYLALFPGVILREVSQWLVAKALKVKVKKFAIWPEKQKGGTIRLALIDIDDMTGPVRATLVGIVPVLVGIFFIGLIGLGAFRTQELVAGLSTGDVPSAMAGLNTFFSTPDFWLWTYLIFAIANAMLPEAHDRISWWLLGGVLVGIVIILLVLDLGILLQAGLNGPFADLARSMSLALTLSLLIDWLVMLLITITEWVYGRFFNREVEYR